MKKKLGVCEKNEKYKWQIRYMYSKCIGSFSFEWSIRVLMEFSVNAIIPQERYSFHNAW